MPSVPHEGFLGRLGMSILWGQSAVLATVAVAGAVMSTTSPGPARVLGLALTLPHVVLVSATAVLGAVMCLSRRAMRRWAVVQFAVYTILFLAGITVGMDTAGRSGFALNGPDHALHGALAVLGFVIAMLSSARIIEPPPAPPPNPAGGTTTVSTDRDRAT